MSERRVHLDRLGRDLDSFYVAEKRLADELRKPPRDRDCEIVTWWMHALSQNHGNIVSDLRALEAEGVSDPLLDRAGAARATMKALRDKVREKCIKAT